MTAIYSHALTEQCHVTIGFFLEQNTLFKLDWQSVRTNNSTNLNCALCEKTHTEYVMLVTGNKLSWTLSKHY